MRALVLVKISDDGTEAKIWYNDKVVNLDEGAFKMIKQDLELRSKGSVIIEVLPGGLVQLRLNPITSPAGQTVEAVVHPIRRYIEEEY